MGALCEEKPSPTQAASSQCSAQTAEGRASAIFHLSYSAVSGNLMAHCALTQPRPSPRCRPNIPGQLSREKDRTAEE